MYNNSNNNNVEKFTMRVTNNTSALQQMRLLTLTFLASFVLCSWKVVSGDLLDKHHTRKIRRGGDQEDIYKLSYLKQRFLDLNEEEEDLDFNSPEESSSSLSSPVKEIVPDMKTNLDLFLEKSYPVPAPNQKIRRLPGNSPTPNPATPNPATPAPVSSTPKPNPGGRPSESPSRTPSRTPSAHPSRMPSRTPSATPSRMPSKTPSATPSKTPSATPSRTPSATPSSLPSKTPSATPSRTPSATPSSLPSKTPSRTPSATPSKSSSPSRMPSKTPSQTPSETPSTSSSPSRMPSAMPSRTPSKKPSQTPSVTPSTSLSPSRAPSKTPSQTPSMTPSLSLSPSRTPSKTPSRTPSSSPSRMPSVTPSRTPSRMPSAKPSLTPSSSPSRMPSKTPSAPILRTIPSSCAAHTDCPNHIIQKGMATIDGKKDEWSNADKMGSMSETGNDGLVNIADFYARYDDTKDYLYIMVLFKNGYAPNGGEAVKFNLNPSPADVVTAPQTISVNGVKLGWEGCFKAKSNNSKSNSKKLTGCVGISVTSNFCQVSTNGVLQSCVGGRSVSSARGNSNVAFLDSYFGGECAA